MPGPVCQARAAGPATPCPSQPQVLKSLPEIYGANKRSTMFMLQWLTCSLARINMEMINRTAYNDLQAAGMAEAQAQVVASHLPD